MADIIDFTAKKKQKNPGPIVTLEQVAQDTIEGLLDDWEKMARKNKLNAFFISALPNFIDQQTKTNFMSDLNAIASVEKNLGLMLSVRAPGSIDVEQFGWVAQFRIENLEIDTPDMAAEEYARCFAILAYVTIKYNAQSVELL